MKIIDLRSDTVTKPSPEMKKLMFEAEVGDDVYGEDPTVNKLEKFAAEMLGTEDAIFASSGTQTNLIALLSHCERGEEYIVGQEAHTYIHEGGGSAVLGSIQPQPIEFEEDGTIDLKKAEAKIKPDDYHFAKTKLFSLENTNNGKVLPLEYIKASREFVDKHNLSFHLDGARVFNAAVKLNVDIKEITKYFDSISICLSKGLGAPIGSLLCGSKELILKARRWRKMLGGGMRQAGLLAEAGIYALENNVQRLAIDHENAKILSDGLNTIPELQGKISEVQTNMMFIDADEKRFVELQEFMKSKGILIGGYGSIRLVTHLDISRDDIDVVIEAFKEFYFSK
ncbi:MAG: low-specificity L-threonine aldolase [Candidatus Delongbacteria bacterium]|jgi:threonine aldolase|nr:low-specificity L-threonine aldolase [Candidatus Delongbacteria bacterium]